MTTNLWLHRVPKQIREFEAEIRDLIGSAPGIAEKDREQFQGEARFEVHRTASLVFTGQYSSGKSTLIKALTDGQATVSIDADVSTDEVKEHRWGDVILVDTPGVQAGVQRHDDLAASALASADLVVFTVTGHGFDDALSRHAAFVAEQLGKQSQMAVVWTQKGKFMPQPQVQRDHLRAAIGSAADGLPVLATDAQWYLDALENPTAGLSARKRQESGIDELRAVLNDLSAGRGELARFLQPLQNMQVVLASLESRLVEDRNEAVALDLLARQERAVVRQLEALETSMRDARRQFEDDSLRQASLFADAMDPLDGHDTADIQQATADAEHNLRTGLEDAAERYGNRLEQEIQRIVRAVRSEMDDIESGPQARHFASIGVISIDQQDGRQRRTPFGRLRQPPPPPSWAKDLAGHMGKMHAFWGAGAGVKASAGSTGHKIVLDAGHLLGHKFKPWQAVKVANNVGKAMKFAGPAILVGSVAYEIWAQERNERRLEEAKQARRNGLREAIRGQAQSIADQTEMQIRTTVVGPFEEALDEIASTRSQITGRQSDRSAAQVRIQSLRQRIADVIELVASTSTTPA